MSDAEPIPAPAGSEREAGRTDDPESLRRRLAGASAAYLDGARENPALGKAEIRTLLRNRSLRAESIAEIADDARWNRHHGVRHLIVRHPATPLIVARRLVPQLFWRELAETAADLRVHPRIRHQAETALRMRLEDLSRGERVALARRATRGILTAMVQSDDDRLLRALIENPRSTERDLVTIAGNPRNTPPLLAHLAAHPRWAARPSVRQALLRNPRTPVPSALQIVGRLPKAELRGLIRDAKVPKIVRIGAERRLSAAGGGQRVVRAVLEARGPGRFQS